MPATEQLYQHASQEEIYRTLIQTSPDTILLVDHGGTIVYANEQLSRMFGYAEDDVLGHPIETLIPERFSERHPGHVRDYFADPRSRPMGIGLELIGSRKDGTEFPVEVSLNHVELDGEGYASAAVRDISERLEQRETIDEQSRLIQELKEAHETIAEQSEALMELSTPVVKVWQEIILLPLIGMLDTERSQQMIERMLHSITDEDAKVAILDVTGVPVMDTSVARHLLQAVDAAKVLGCSVIITGISPNAAQTLATLGVDFGRISTRGSLQAGVSEAFKLVRRSL